MSVDIFEAQNTVSNSLKEISLKGLLLVFSGFSFD
jgi:hypothetical protein